MLQGRVATCGLPDRPDARLLPRQPARSPVHLQNVGERRIWLNLMAGTDDESTSFEQIKSLLNFCPHAFCAGKRQNLLDTHRAGKSQAVAKLLLERGQVHAGGVGLHDVQDV